MYVCMSDEFLSAVRKAVSVETSERVQRDEREKTVS